MTQLDGKIVAPAVEEKFEINEDLQSSENIPSSENDEQKSSY